MDSSSSTSMKQLTADAQVGSAAERKTGGVTVNTRIAILLAIWIFALVPLLFVRTEWFGRPLSDQQIGEYLHAEQPYLVQHALTQIGDRMARHDASVSIWYADLIRLAGHPNDDVRALDATVMGNYRSRQSFHDALRPLLDDSSRLVRFRAALALAQFGDSSGREEIVAGLQPWIVVAPAAGRIKEMTHLGGSARQSMAIVRIDADHVTADVVAPVNGRVLAVAFKAGDAVQSGAELLQLNPAPDVVADVITGLGQVGGMEDLPVVSALEARATLPDRVRQRATIAVQAIRARVGYSEIPAGESGLQPK